MLTYESENGGRFVRTMAEKVVYKWLDICGRKSSKNAVGRTGHSHTYPHTDFSQD